MAASLLSAFKGTVKDQGDRPTCVAFALTGLHEYWIDISCGGGSCLLTDLSEEFLHFHAKRRDRLAASSGTTVDAASTSLRIEGQCVESLHPYKDGGKPIVVPSQEALEDGKKRILKTLTKQKFNIGVLESALEQRLPVLSVIELFRSSYTPGPKGLLPEPAQGDMRLGLHAVLLVWIEESTTPEVVFKNSWGTGWGDQGFGRMTFEYLQDHCSELWTVT